MRYIPHTDEDIRKMLEKIGVASPAELFSDIPENVRLKGELNLPDSKSEQDVVREFNEFSKTENACTDKFSYFLGAGAYPHYVPAPVSQLVNRGEFLTAYTPYQPEVSQGSLQAFFEFQTMICMLTGMDYSNASLYDGATAVAEAAMLSVRKKRKKKILCSRTLHPYYRSVLKTYFAFNDGEIEEIGFTESGTTDMKELSDKIDQDTAAVIVQSPNFFGRLEDLKKIRAMTEDKKSLFVSVVSELLSLGLLKPPGEYGADIVVGESQSFGNSLNYGGPYVGFMAAQKKFLRTMPGRLVGQTVDSKGRKGYVLTLSTREQHIRRERATSNICTNQALCALSAVIHMSLLGKKGIRELAVLNAQKAHYAWNKLKNLKGIKERYPRPFFNEFTLSFDKDVDTINRKLAEKNIIGGFNLGKEYPELKNEMLLCVTELNSKKDIDRLANALEEIL